MSHLVWILIHITKKNLLPLNHPKGPNINSEGEASAWNKYILWMADMLTDEDETTPMFVGWNARGMMKYKT